MIKKVVNLSDEGEILNEKSYRFNIFDPDNGYLFKNRAYYIKSFTNHRLSDVLQNKIDIANMHILAENIYADTNMIVYQRNKKIHPAGIAEIARMINTCEKRTKKFIDRMLEKELLAKYTSHDGEVIYYINPVYFSSSKYLSYHLYLLFRKQLDEHLPPWVIERFNETNHIQKNKK